ncbi:glycosyltransferase family 39 protein [Candidatus Amoebophilus asiaticus]|nr:glycosyltransferase family 39 protein [Candidatus Amoebophilus asiaticus]
MFFTRKSILVLIILSFILKLFLAFFFVEEISTWEDTEIAKNLLQTGELKIMQRGTWNYNFQFPIFPLIIYVIYLLFGITDLCVIIFQLVISAFSACLLYEVLNGFGSYLNITGLDKGLLKKICFISVVIFLFHPFISYYSLYNVHPFTLNLFSALLALFVMFKFFEKRTLSYLILYGVVLGWVILDRSTLMVVFTPFVILCMRNYDFLSGLKKILLALVVCSITISPWLIRNYLHYHELAVTSTTGEILWKGAIYGSDGGNHLIDGRHYLHALTAAEDRLLTQMPIMKQKQFFMGKYMHILRNDPGHIISMYLKKLNNFWWFRELMGIDYGDNFKKYIPYYKAYYVICLIFVLIAIYKLRTQVLLILSFPVMLSLFQSVFYVETRHRVIIEPFLVFIALIGVVYLIRNFSAFLPGRNMTDKKSLG